jgi:hypothetical protein
MPGFVETADQYGFIAARVQVTLSSFPAFRRL